MAERPVSAQRPYLLRAMHEWMMDNGMTPHVVVDMSSGDIDVPEENIKDGKVVLNISYAATRGLVIGNDAVTFEARFNGVPRSLYIPIDAVLGIYARESGQGMIFAEEETPPPDDTSPDIGGAGKRPSLKVVK
jgi:stringent starvation protein B